MQSTRNWADGHSDRGRHIIADIHYGADESTLTCLADGVTLSASTPEALASQWRNHGGKVEGDLDGNPPAITPSQDRRVAAMAAIVEVGRRCTCATTDLRDCPNYLPEDEEGDND